MVELTAGQSGTVGPFTAERNYDVTTSAGSQATISVTFVNDKPGLLPVQNLTASGPITIGSGIVTLAHTATIIAATLPAPTPGDQIFIIDSSASGTIAHTVTVPSGVTWDGTNTIATLNAVGEGLHVVAISATRWFILDNLGTVTFS